MLSKLVLPLLVAAILAIPCEPAVAQSGDAAPEAPDVESPIQPSSEHPFYWEYGGEPVVLIGGSDDDNLFQWTGDRLTGHLDSLAAVGGNYVRNTMSDRDEDDVYAFAEVGEGVYDLDPWVYADTVRVRWLDIDEGTWSEPEVRSVPWEGGLSEWGHRGRVRLTTPSNTSAVALVEVVEMQGER